MYNWYFLDLYSEKENNYSLHNNDNLINNFWLTLWWNTGFLGAFNMNDTETIRWRRWMVYKLEACCPMFWFRCPQCTDSGDRVWFIPFILVLVVDAINTLYGVKHLEITRELQPEAPITRMTVAVLSAEYLLSHYRASQKEHASHNFSVLTHQ